MKKESDAAWSDLILESDGLVGEVVTNAQLGLGTILILDFSQGSTTPVDAYLRVECAWLIEKHERGLVASGDERSAAVSNVAALLGAVVEGLHFEHFGRVAIALSGGYRVSVFPLYVASMDYDSWTLRLRSGAVYTAGQGGQLVRGLGDLP